MTANAYAQIQAELEWLKENPEFEERPATLLEFLGPEYLNVESGIRERIKEELSNIMGEEVHADRITDYPLAMITGGIGIGKTTIASQDFHGTLSVLAEETLDIKHRNYNHQRNEQYKANHVHTSLTLGRKCLAGKTLHR